VQQIFYCNKCVYSTDRKASIERHFLTAKHQKDDAWMTQSVDNISQDNINFVLNHRCDCGKVYKFRQGLFKHKKMCLTQSNKNLIEIVKYQMEESKEIRSFIKEQQTLLLKQNSHIQKLTDQQHQQFPTQIINNYQKTTNKFNLNFFLNVQCKDALNLGDFIDSVSIGMDELENTGKVGFVDGISKIILSRLKELDIYKRPVHCSDIKREIMYIKNEDIWTKDKEDSQLKLAIETLGTKHINKLPNWISENPKCVDINSKSNLEYINLLSNCLLDNNDSNNYKKVICKLAKEVYINKTDEPK
jgi:hypothetical protein